MAVYRATARRREAQAQQERERRIRRAWVVARQAASLLKERFGARQVVLYGSLARRDFFHRRSDIDLAVAGIAPRDFWRAWSALDRLDSRFEIDLMDMEDLSPALRLQIEREGVEL